MIGILNLERGFAAKFIKFKADLGAADGLAAQRKGIMVQRRADAAMEFIFLAYAAIHVD